jgi:exopolyphosphatase / guanosine-5'-triphosphate,3'-diphosphate pyrophosphatase
VSEGQRRAIVDIGSNTIRLVVFGGAVRVPIILYNEKVIAGLGRGVVSDGHLAESAMAVALAGLARFKVLIDSMDVSSLRVVATAAVRDAQNGAEFLGRVHALGLPVELLSGDEEARASGYGVISEIPGADGVVADLGGGSLELVRVAQGHISQLVSLPLGILNVPGIRARGEGTLRRHIQTLVAQNPWAWRSHNLPLYLVGGSWRSLARVHIHQTGFPLPVIGRHSMKPEEVRPLSDAIQVMDRAAIKAIPAMPNGRVPMVADAAALLAALVEAISPSEIITCAFGLREGLMFQALSPTEKQLDPLIEGVRFATKSQDQFPGRSDALMQWLNRLFGSEEPDFARLRHSVCLLFGTGWASNPDFRAISGEELMLHGNWAGVTARDRAIMGMALYVGLGGTADAPAILGQLADSQSLDRARAWGLALRLAQRLSGGSTSILNRSCLDVTGPTLTLSLPTGLASLDDQSVRRRLDRLANSVGAETSEIIIAEPA